MSTIVETVNGTNCSICLNNFEDDEKKYSHLDAGGYTVNHDGFHLNCLKTWCKQREICPLDREPLDIIPFYSRSERCLRNMKKCSSIFTNGMVDVAGRVIGMSIGMLIIYGMTHVADGILPQTPRPLETRRIDPMNALTATGGALLVVGVIGALAFRFL